MKAEKKIVLGQSSWVVKSGSVELALTETGAHMAPVQFYADSKSPVQPYYISPWSIEKIKQEDKVLNPLRGDFFCMPFGADNAYKGETHGTHGEPASGKWKNAKLTKEDGITAFSIEMDTKMRPGKVMAVYTLKDGQNVVYTEHTLEGYTGPMCLGHHATLAAPKKEGGMSVATAPIRFGYTSPRDTESLAAANGEYFALSPGKRFTSIKKIPTIWKDKPYMDCSVYPQQEGFCDIIGVIAKERKTPHWTAAAVPSEGYMWFSLKDPSILPTTVFWMSNKGRHGSPWNGKNQCLGLEDVCAYLASGLNGSAKKNPLNEEGVATVLKLSKTKPAVIRYIQGVVKIPSTFDTVKTVKFSGSGEVLFTSQSGKEVKAPVDWEYVFGK